MRAALNLNLDGLWNIVGRLRDPALIRELEDLPKDPEVAALMSQAIADNFDMEGPGWKPLKLRTIMESVSAPIKKKLKKLTKEEFWEREAITKKLKRSEHDKTRLVALNAKAGFKGSNQQLAPARAILQGSGLLRNSVTHVGAMHNIYQPTKNKLIWGTDLAYAAIHNNGGTIHWPGTDKGFGPKKYVRHGKKIIVIGGRRIPPHGIPIPQRRFLYLQPKWLEEIRKYVTDKARKIVAAKVTHG